MLKTAALFALAWLGASLVFGGVWWLLLGSQGGDRE